VFKDFNEKAMPGETYVVKSPILSECLRNMLSLYCPVSDREGSTLYSYAIAVLAVNNRKINNATVYFFI
jgi:hypothetical protein